MLTAYTSRSGAVVSDEPHGESLPESCVWLDLLNPTSEEDAMVEQRVGVDVPSIEQMSEIESSSRMYIENGARYLTMTLVADAEGEKPHVAAVTCILAGNRLVTVRHDELRAFTAYSQQIRRSLTPPQNGEAALMGLLEVIIDRAADLTEKIGASVDEISQWVFEQNVVRATRRRNYRAVLRAIGRKGGVLSMARESLVSISRVLLFLSADTSEKSVSKDSRAELRTMLRDVRSVLDHITFLSDKITFILDAALGMVTLEQNDIVQAFSVVSVVLMPPTLIASAYGMNFHNMPELNWSYGYPIALLAMLLSSVLPFLFFRWKRWL